MGEGQFGWIPKFLLSVWRWEGYKLDNSKNRIVVHRCSQHNIFESTSELSRKRKT